MVTLNLEPVIRLSPEQFTQLCYANPEAKLEKYFLVSRWNYLEF